MKAEEAKPLPIAHWSPDDRPREKLLHKGTGALSDAELLAILIGSGTARLSAVEVAKQILKQSGHNLHDLARLSAHDLMKMKGIGQAKAITIMAAFELGRRRREADMDEKPQVKSSTDAFRILQPHLMDLPHEEFWILLTNRANRVIKTRRISEGGVAGTVADPKIIFKCALEELASGIIVAHNHPSGNLSPSPQDLDLTRKLKEGGKLLEIQLLDHLIVAGLKYYSLADEGHL